MPSHREPTDRPSKGRARVTRPWCAGLALAGLLTVAGCGDSDEPSSERPDRAERQQPDVELADGPVTLVTLGDSLTSGDGDETGEGGYAGRLVAAISEYDGREGSTLVNLGVSGWDSTMMVDGADGSDPQLGPAVDAVRTAVDEGQAVIATVLIGSNDLWYTYEYSPGAGTTAEEEDAAADVYRENLDRAVGELTDAGATVVVGLPDDQSVRPGAADISRLNTVLPSVTEEEVQQMSALSEVFGDIAVEVADEHDALTVDTNDPFWSDPGTMADDGIHPNAAGYERLTELWLGVLDPVL